MGGPQASPEPLTRPPRRSSIKNLLPIILNGGCANLDGTRPLQLKCSSRPDLSTPKSPFQSSVLNEFARKGYIQPPWPEPVSPKCIGIQLSQGAAIARTIARGFAPNLLPCKRVVCRV
jgi:hypothetical protein